MHAPLYEALLMIEGKGAILDVARRLSHVLVAFLGMIAAGACATEFVVAPDGNDQDPGTVARPLATMAGAKAAVQRLLAGGGEDDISVLFRGGSYPQLTPVVFGPADSACGKQMITYAAYPGEMPVFSGGRKISGWQKKGAVWTAAIPEAKGGKWVFRRLYVGDERRPLARIPNESAEGQAGDFFRVAGPVSADPNGAFAFTAGNLRKWPGYAGANIVALKDWESFSIPFAAIDEEKAVATLAGKAKWPFRDGQRYFVENLPDALDAPGEWYLEEASGILSYIPKSEEDMAKLEVVAPVATAFITVAGDGKNGKPVQGLRFRGLHVRHGDYILEPKGHSDWQAAESVPAMVTFTDADNCTFEQGEISDIGGYAIEVGPGCNGVRIEQNEMRDLGAGGVKVRSGSSRTTIHNNFIHDGGNVFFGGTPILVQDSGENTITHNEICDFNWMGICVGWTWGFQPSHAHNNTIEYNHLHHLGRGVTSDIGAIYTLGISTGTTIRNNLIHHVWDHPEGYLACGIYPDEGSTGLLIENNIVYQTSWGGFHCHYGRDNIVRNNIFAFGRSAQIHMGRGKGSGDGANWVDRTNSSMTLEHNIVLYDRGDLFRRDSELTADYNLYWNMAGPVVFQPGVDLAKWQAKGRDAHGVVADPKFVDPTSGDFHLKPDSPALALGFKPIDMSTVGLVGDAAWIDKPRQIQRAPVVIPAYKDIRVLEAIDDGFETTRPGLPPRDGQVNGATGNAWIRVTGEVAAEGSRSLKFRDAPGLTNAYDPHIFYTLDAAKGVTRASFDIRMEKGAICFHEWRDWSVNPYIVGPSLLFDAEGGLAANGKKLMTVPPGQWVHISIECPLGVKADGTYKLTVAVPGQEAQTFEKQGCDKRFAHITWLGFSSMATESTTFYIDNLKFAAKP